MQNDPPMLRGNWLFPERSRRVDRLSLKAGESTHGCLARWPLNASENDIYNIVEQVKAQYSEVLDKDSRFEYFSVVEEIEGDAWLRVRAVLVEKPRRRLLGKRQSNL